jgi:hypothetical protein
MLSEVLSKFVERRTGQGNVQAANAAMPSYGRRHLHVGDSGDVVEMAGRRIGKAFDPGSTRFLNVSFDDGTGVEEESSHR